MSATKVDLYVSQLIEDLSNGLSWLKTDDFGFGSIQEKYGANEIQIKTIQKHPKLLGLETSVTIFNVIDDLKEVKKSEETPASRTEPISTITKQSPAKGTDEILPEPVVPMASRPAKVELPISKEHNQSLEPAGVEESNSESSEFFNL